MREGKKIRQKGTNAKYSLYGHSFVEGCVWRSFALQYSAS